VFRGALQQRAFFLNFRFGGEHAGFGIKVFKLRGGFYPSLGFSVHLPAVKPD
jgi:hypothetical protein